MQFKSCARTSGAYYIILVCIVLIDVLQEHHGCLEGFEMFFLLSPEMTISVLFLWKIHCTCTSDSEFWKKNASLLYFVLRVIDFASCPLKCVINWILMYHIYYILFKKPQQKQLISDQPCFMEGY